jgi:hypothetical protein
MHPGREHRAEKSDLNCTPRDSEAYTGYLAQIDDLVKTLGRAPALETATRKEA